MRIVYINQYFNTRAMPGITRSFEMARRLVAYGHEVHMVTSWREPSSQRGWYTQEIEGIHVHWLPVVYSNKMGFWARVRAFLRFATHSSFRAASIKADVVFATSGPLTIALPGIYAAWRLRVPLVFEVRDLWPEVPIAMGILRNPVLKWGARWLERFTYRYSSRVVALGPGMKENIIESGIDPRRVSIVPNGCDLDLFSTAADVLLSADRIVLYAGAIGPANGPDYLPRLAAAIRDRHPDAGIRIVVIGDGKELNNIKALSNRLGLTGAEIEFFGALSKEEIPAHIARCRMTIMTYTGPEILYRDSVSNKFFDSLAAGRMVVANFAGFSTLIAKAVGAGELLPSDDLDEAADRVVRLMLDDESLMRGGRQALALARDVFNRDRLARMLETVLLQAHNRIEPGVELPVGDEFRELWVKARAGILDKTVHESCRAIADVVE